MKTLQSIVSFLIPIFVLLTCKGIGLTYESPENEVQQIESSEFVYEPGVAAGPVDCFEYAEQVTGFPAEILRGIAATESHFRTGAVGDDGLSFGMFQLHSAWHDSRVEKWGEYDPVDPFESTVIAGYIMKENLDAFDGDLRKAIAAYRQGISGVNRNGVTEWYVEEILNWRADFNKIESYILFKIENIYGM